MKPLLLLFLTCALIGCHSGRQQARWIPPAFDPPRAGQIQVALFGDVKASGTQWIGEPVTLASIERGVVDGAGDSALRKVMITRTENGHANNTVLVIAKMSQQEKEAVALRHGDVVQFYTQQPEVFPQ
jgi:hypothetical protein